MKNIQMPALWPVTSHTDYVSKNGTFVAIPGARYEGNSFIPLALEKGARTIIADVTSEISDEIKALIAATESQLLFVENPRKTLAFLAAKGWGYPADSLKIIAITGTKGKTTTAWLLAHLLKQADYKVALLSTVKNMINDHAFDTHLTTQHPDYLHAFFHVCAREKIEYVVMEVAAQAVSLHRSAGLAFDGLIFTNFAAAHGEFYATVDEYYAAKYALLAQVKKGCPILVNGADEKGKELLMSHPGAIPFDGARHLITSNESGIHGSLKTDLGEEELFTCSALLGDFNSYNIMAAVEMACQIGVPLAKIAQALTNFAGVPGRLERHALPNGATCIIDYAHNPLSFKALLSLLRSLTPHLIVVAGAGGERDKDMRPLLGACMAEYADAVIITTDNPRSEDPAAIAAAMQAGIAEAHQVKVSCRLDREQAIAHAYAVSRAGSIIALLGKGPEEYQIIGTQKLFFSERAVIKAL